MSRDADEAKVIRGAIRFKGTHGPLKVTWPFAKIWADDHGVYAAIFEPMRWFTRVISFSAGAEPVGAGIAWSTPWDNLVEVRIARRSASFLERGGDRTTYIAPTAHSFRPLKAAIMSHAPYSKVATTMFDGFRSP